MDELYDHTEGGSRARMRMAWVVVLPIAILAGLGLALATRSRDNNTSGEGSTQPAATLADDGPDWTNLELLHHLRDRGLTVRMTAIGGDTLYVLTDSQDDAIAAAITWGDSRHDSLAVLCRKHSTSTDARVDADRRQSGTFAWGRFTFSGNGTGTTAVVNFQKALTGGSNTATDRPK